MAKRVRARKRKKAPGLRELADGLTSGDYEIGIQLSHRRPFHRRASDWGAYQTYPVAYEVVLDIGPAKRDMADKIFARAAAAARSIV